MGNKAILNIPRTDYGNSLQLLPFGDPKATTTISTSGTVANHTLQTGTNFVSITVLTAPVYFKKGTGCTTADDGWTLYLLEGETYPYALEDEDTAISFITDGSAGSVKVVEW